MLDSRLAWRDRNSTKVDEKGEKEEKEEEDEDNQGEEEEEDREEEEEEEDERRNERRSGRRREREKVEGPREVNVRLCDHWRMHTPPSLPVSQN